MDLFSREDLGDFLRNQRQMCVSMFMPTTRGVRNEDRTHWKNLVREAEDRLAERGQAARELLDPARALLDDSAFWLNASEGLAFLLAPDISRAYRLPVAFKPQVVVGEHFHIKPLLPLLTGDGRFYVLVLSRKQARLLQGTRQTIGEVALPGAPEPVPDEAETAQVAHAHAAPGGPADRRRANAQGYEGVALDSTKEGFREYAHAVDRALQRVLGDEQAPLVLAGVDYLVAMFHDVSSHRDVLSESIHGNPDRLSDRDLHERAWAVVEPHFQEEQRQLAALYQQLSGTGRTVAELPEILAAAHEGQLQYLFVSAEPDLWGAFDPASRRLEFHEQAQPGDEDLVNLAAVQALAHKTTVYAVKPDEVPGGKAMAGIFWLPLGERRNKKVMA